MDPRCFLELADNLIANTNPGPAAARFRTITSRAYYAGHLAAREFLESLDSQYFQFGKNRDAHTYVPRYLNYSANQALKHVSSQLNALRAKRTTADYDMGNPDAESEDFSADAIDDARDVISALDGFTNDPAVRSAILAEIKKTNRSARGISHQA